MKKLITMAIIGFVAATTAPLANAAGTAARRKPVPTPRPEKGKATHEKAESDIKRMKN